ncbi:TcpQ domain-containing protein [Glaciecola petra]|uniref:TcpQ domain-containing protein n=1 Tax=Glaciecola petra TaxID=3075602 RepID=A0ABU2ZQ45_9ALTE|nr:TcpQ domain-containing protein [Aestuariibacter sp. P117]MDT0593587.1 TcpQ domain-containing protein [Aestuariibacter sp. P117]
MKDSMTNFWLKRIGAMLVVISCAIAFLVFKPEHADKSAVNTKSLKNTSVAESVSNFYAEFRQTSRDPIKERYGEYVVVLEENNEAVSELIDNVSDQLYPPMSNWEGNYQERAFSSQSTLMQEAKKYAAAEGFNLVWDLKHDFIIRNRFQSNNTLIGMLEEIAGAVDANFDKPILVYFCFQKRALVLTTKENNFLANNCQKSPGSLAQNY